ncbi:MAG: S-adenosylmethionine decarboxylase [Desulfobacterales bacterium]
MTTKNEKVTFGWELIMDLYGCDPAQIASEAAIRDYAVKLCKLLKMKPYGDPQTPYFGENQEHTKGYSLLQFIETSSITGHFSEHTRAAYINIFSCKWYDMAAAENFTKKHFGAGRVNSRFIVRE